MRVKYVGIGDVSGVQGRAGRPGDSSRDDDGNLVTNGGRVLAVQARGPDVEAARQRAYAAAALIHFDGMQMRRDIAAGMDA